MFILNTTRDLITAANMFTAPTNGTNCISNNHKTGGCVSCNNWSHHYHIKQHEYFGIFIKEYNVMSVIVICLCTSFCRYRIYISTNQYCIPISYYSPQLHMWHTVFYFSSCIKSCCCNWSSCYVICSSVDCCRFNSDFNYCFATSRITFLYYDTGSKVIVFIITITLYLLVTIKVAVVKV